MRPGGRHYGRLQLASLRLRPGLCPAGGLCGRRPGPRLGVWDPDVVANLLASAHPVQRILPAGARQPQVLICNQLFSTSTEIQHQNTLMY